MTGRHRMRRTSRRRRGNPTGVRYEGPPRSDRPRIPPSPGGLITSSPVVGRICPRCGLRIRVDVLSGRIRAHTPYGGRPTIDDPACAEYPIE